MSVNAQLGHGGDNWKHRSSMMWCQTCMFWMVKEKLTEGIPVNIIGRCKRHAPTMNGFPVVFATDWCGDHKLDENKGG
jgi:hypothetical protein